MGNFIIQDYNSRPVWKPRTRWEAVVQRDTSHILGIWGWKWWAENRRMEVSSAGGQGPEGAVGPKLLDGFEISISYTYVCYCKQKGVDLSNSTMQIKLLNPLKFNICYCKNFRPQFEIWSAYLIVHSCQPDDAPLGRETSWNWTNQLLCSTEPTVISVITIFHNACIVCNVQ